MWPEEEKGNLEVPVPGAGEEAGVGSRQPAVLSAVKQVAEEKLCSAEPAVYLHDSVTGLRSQPRLLGGHGDLGTF